MAFLGLGLGALYAMLGQSIVVARLGSGLVNLAAGAMAVSATYQFVELRREGDLVLPLLDVLPGALDVPVRLSLSDGGLAFWPAFVGALAMAALVGLVVHLVVAWPLRHAAPAAQAAAMVGVLLYLQGTVALADRLGERGRSLEAVLPHRMLSNFAGSGRSLPTDALYAAGVAVLLAVVLVGGHAPHPRRSGPARRGGRPPGRRPARHLGPAGLGGQLGRGRHARRDGGHRRRPARRPTPRRRSDVMGGPGTGRGPHRGPAVRRLGDHGGPARRGRPEPRRPRRHRRRSTTGSPMWSGSACPTSCHSW